MIKLPSSWAEAEGFIAKAVWVMSRLHIFSVLVGAAVTLTIQFLSGYWTFVENHQKEITTNIQRMVEADEIFESHRVAFDAVFESELPEPKDDITYAEAARQYITRLEVLSSQLPETSDELQDLREAVADLNKYYSETDLPSVGSVDWIVFYGEYRQDLDRFLSTRKEYLAEVSSEAASYWRYLWRS